MNIGLIDVDSHNFPNLALMKISAYHKAKGDKIEWWNGLKHYDIVYKSKVFDDTYSKDENHCINAEIVIQGGTGYNIYKHLLYEIEHQYPDYSLYKITDTAYGFLTRGCPRNCPFCIVTQKEGEKTLLHSPLTEFWEGQKYIKLLDPNLLAHKEHEGILKALIISKAWIDFTQGLDIRLTTKENIILLDMINIKIIHFAWDNPKEDLVKDFERFNKHSILKDPRRKGVYVLTNYNSTHEEDLYRINTIKTLGFDPYVMIYDKPNAPRKTRLLQRWCNNRIIFKSVPDFKDYDPKMG